MLNLNVEEERQGEVIDSYQFLLFGKPWSIFSRAYSLVWKNISTEFEIGYKPLRSIHYDGRGACCVSGEHIYDLPSEPFILSIEMRKECPKEDLIRRHAISKYTCLFPFVLFFLWFVLALSKRVNPLPWRPRVHNVHPPCISHRAS